MTPRLPISLERRVRNLVRLIALVSLELPRASFASASGCVASRKVFLII